MRNRGEVCTAANRFLVQESITEEFTKKFASAMAALTTGRGTEPGNPGRTPHRRRCPPRRPRPR